MKEHNHTHEHECDCHEHTHHHDHNCHEHEHDCDCHGHKHEHEHDHSCHGHHHDHGCCGQEHHQEGHTGHEFDKVSADIEQKVYILENLGCANCAAKMEEQIGKLDGVKMATITFATKQLRVAANNQEALLPKIRQICSSIEEEVTVTPREEKAAEKKASKESLGAEKRKELVEIGIGAVLFVLGVLLEKLGAAFVISAIVFVGAYLLLGREIVWTAVKNLVKGHVFDENFLMSIATLAAFALGDFPEAVGVMLFYRIGELFEHMAVERSRSQIMEAVDLRPEVVNLVEGTQVRVIPAEEAKIGDILLIRPGDRIPLDGVVIEGESRIDTSPMTGEPVPVRVKVGSELLSGCVNEQGVLRMEVRKALGDSMVTRILDSVENAAASKPKLDRFITRFARVYTPVVVLIAVLTAILPSLATGNWDYWLYTAITFLVISCPCALVLSVPLAFFSGIGAGSKKGILFKGGAAIEALQNVKAVVMDKTGTVTKGEFRVQSIVTSGGISEQELLQLAAQCELASTHPIGQSIVEKAKELHMALESPEQTEELSGKGIRAIISGREILCGNKELLRAHGIDVLGAVDGQCSTEVLLARDMKFIGYIQIADTIKDDAKASVQAMKRQKLRTVMLTGDARREAEMVAEATGIDEVYAKLLPEDKLRKLQEIRNRYGAVMFVGDGINDAPVLAGADVGAAMGSGADAAIEAADVVFMNSSVGAITQAIRIAKQTGNIAMQNVVVALAIKAFVMILGLLGNANMWMAVFADTGVAMLCVLNSVRILYMTKGIKKEDPVL